MKKERKALHPELEEIIVNWMDTHFISQHAGRKISGSILGESEEVGRRGIVCKNGCCRLI